MLYSLTGVTLTPHGYGMGDIERLWLDSLIHSLYRYKPTSPSPCDNNEKILKQELWQSSGSFFSLIRSKALSNTICMDESAGGRD